MRAALGVLDALTQAANVVGTVLIVALMVLIGVDVAGRNLMNAPLAGVPEMVTLSIVAIVFLQIPQALRAGRLTRMDALPRLLARRAPLAGRLLETLFDLLAIAIVGVIARMTWPIFLRAWERGEFIGALGDFTAPVWPVKAAILLGCALLMAQFAARILRRWAEADDDAH